MGKLYHLDQSLLIVYTLLTMPVTKSAYKKMRQDKKRRIVNLKTLARLKGAITKARKKPTAENLKLAISIIDQAGKKRIIHKNKAARLKSRLVKRGKDVQHKPTSR